MGFSLREIPTPGKFSQELSCAALAAAVPPAAVTAALQITGVHTPRVRKLDLAAIVWLPILMSLITDVSIGRAWRKFAQGLRYIWPDPAYPLPTDGALTYRRYQLGARPLVALFHTCCQPLATPLTPGAYLFGLRTLALDSTTEDVPDSPANAAAFGRLAGGRGASAFPQVLGVYLVECGTHAILDAGFWPCTTNEQVGARRLLRSVGPGTLLLVDRGLHAYDLLLQARQRHAHVLSRLPGTVQPRIIQPLADGSYLAELAPSDYARRKTGERLLVRLICYTLTDPALPGYGETHRLVTTLLDPHQAPAPVVAWAYHERWEIELVIDEVDTHQRLAGRPLRSRKPVGVIQELYGLLVAHYALRRLMVEAAEQELCAPRELSFVHTVCVVHEAVPEFQMTAVRELPRLYQRLLQDIARVRLPARRLRSNPRVVKRKMSKFDLKRPEHQHWPQPTCPFWQAVRLI